jgi:uncharacterized repeat protein (TIGR01451 family)
VSLGGTIAYSLRVSNIGKASALHVRVCDTLPAGLTVLSAPGFHNSGHALCTTIETLLIGVTKRFHLTARVTATSPGVLTNHATASAKNAVSARSKVRTRVLAPPPPPPSPPPGLG